MQTQDTDNTEIALEQSTVITEGGSSASEEVETPAESTETTSEQDVDFFKEKEQQREESRNSRQDALIEKQVDALLDADTEESKEEILSKYPKLRNKIESSYKDVVDDTSDKFVSREDFEALKSKYEGTLKETATQEANRVLNKELEAYGLTKKEFKEKYGESFIDEVALLEKAGIAKSDAIPRALKYLGVTKSDNVGKARENASIPTKQGGSNTFHILSVAQAQSLSMEDYRAYEKKCREQHGKLLFN